MKKIIVYLFLGLIAVGLGYASFQWQHNHKNILQQNHGLPGGPFTLAGPDGSVSLSDFKGKPVLIYFGYAYCPDVCPTSLAIMATAMQQLDVSGVEVAGIFISVDPERDTPETLKTYAPFFHPNIVGLTSDKHRILEVATRYGSYYKKVERGDGKEYLVDHTSRTYVVDSEGELAAIVSHGSPPEEVVAQVMAVL